MGRRSARAFPGLLATLACLALLSGCARGSRAETAVPLSAVDPSNQTVTYWYQHSGSRERAMEALIREFNATNAWHITVKGEYAGDYADIYDKMVTAIAGNSMPDIVVAYQNQAATYEQAGALADLGPYMSSARWGFGGKLSDFFPAFIDQDVYPQFGGKRLGFPPNRSIEVLYYNQDWLKSLGLSGPPATWKEFYRDCLLASRGGRLGYDITTDASNMFAQVISRGGAITGPGGYSLASPQMRASMRFMQRLYRAGGAGRIGEQFGDQTDFGNRKVLFSMGSTSALPFYAQAVKGSAAPFAWSVAAIPHTTPKPVLDVYGASLSVTRSTPERELAAWLFIRWLAEPRQQAVWTRVSNYFPVRISTAASLGDYFAKNPPFKAAFALLRSAEIRTEPPFSGYDVVRDAMSSAYDSILDGADVDRTLAALDARAKRLYAEDAGGD